MTSSRSSAIFVWAFIGLAIGWPTFPDELQADDWRGWMGNDRDGVYRETGIVDKIPESGLTIRWRTPVAGGYAGPAVAEGRVFVFDYERKEGKAFNDPGKRSTLTGSERLQVLNSRTGEPLWTHRYDCPYSVSYPVGPRCTPTIDGDRVYLLGSEGDLRCLRVTDGHLIWKRHLPRDFAAEVPIWGFTSHPLIDGDLLYTMVGGPGQAVMALDKMTGEVRWKALDGEPGYCAPTILDFGGQRQLIVFHPTAVTSLNPIDGTSHWSIPLTPSYGMSIACPVACGNQMYASGIHQEALLIELASGSADAKEAWRAGHKEALHSANSPPVFTRGVIYGTDCNEGCLIAVDAADGSRLWKTFAATKPDEKRFIKHGTAFLTQVGKSDRYFIFSETGDLQMAKLTRSGYQDLGRFHVLEPTSECFGRRVVWSHPAYANQTAYLRNDQEIVAVSLAIGL